MNLDVGASPAGVRGTPSAPPAACGRGCCSPATSARLRPAAGQPGADLGRTAAWSTATSPTWPRRRPLRRARHDADAGALGVQRGARAAAAPRAPARLVAAWPRCSAVSLARQLVVIRDVWHDDHPGELTQRTSTAWTGRARSTWPTRWSPRGRRAALRPPQPDRAAAAPGRGQRRSSRRAPRRLGRPGRGRPPYRAEVESRGRSPGPVPGCGWQLRGAAPPSRSRSGVNFGWWLQIEYLRRRLRAMMVRAQATLVDTDVQLGLDNVYVQVDGTFDPVGSTAWTRPTPVCRQDRRRQPGAGGGD